MKEALVLALKSMIFPGFAFLFVLALFLEWVERKVVAHMEHRIGPLYTGPHGVLQPFADFIKLLFKENIDVAGMDPAVMDLLIILSASLYAFVCFFIPFAGEPIVSFEGDVICAVLLLSVASGLLYLVGWLSSNAYTRVGSVRLLMQVVALDIPLLMILLVPAAITSSLSIAKISASLPGCLARKPWLILVWWPSFSTALLAEQAELERNPFSIPHAETEIVAGYYTEISGTRLAFIDLCRDLQLLATSALIAACFLGGAGALRPPLGLPLMLAEVLLIVFLTCLIRCITARLRIDIVLRGFWRYVLPSSIILPAIALLLAGG